MNRDTLRLDKWFWYARFIKSRSLATKLCNSGKVRVNGSLIKKAHQSVAPGDVLTFPVGPNIASIAESDGPPLVPNTVTFLPFAIINLLDFIAKFTASSRPNLREAGIVSLGSSPLASKNLAALVQLVQPLRK